MKVVIIDYKMGNTYSIQHALAYLGVDEIILSYKEADLFSADKLILPGVGSFRQAMDNLEERNLIEMIKHAVQKKRIPLLGICLGMQLLGKSGTEDGFTSGLNLIDCAVEKFSEGQGRKVPHVGFNTVKADAGNVLYQGMEPELDFYFTHSYRMKAEKGDWINGVCHNGGDFIASVQLANIYGTQFHPEKSQTNGLQLLINFLKI